MEYFNPNQSVKDRIALAMIEDAEKKGLLKPGYTIVETTSGNTGIGLAAIAAAKGYRFRVYVQDNVSEERFRVIKSFWRRNNKNYPRNRLLQTFFLLQMEILLQLSQRFVKKGSFKGNRYLFCRPGFQSGKPCNTCIYNRTGNMGRYKRKY